MIYLYECNKGILNKIITKETSNFILKFLLHSMLALLNFHAFTGFVIKFFSIAFIFNNHNHTILKL